MENHEQNSETNGVNNVEVLTHKSFAGKNSEAQKSLEDSNCNLTILPSKDSLSGVNLVQSCGESELSLNGPVKLLNGIENIQIEDSDCSSNSNVHNTSHCEINVERIEEESTASQSVSENVEACYSLTHKSDSFESSCHILTSTSENSSVDASSNTKLFTEDANVFKEISTVSECASATEVNVSDQGEVVYVSYESELQMPDIMRLIQKDLSEPYSIYTYRYFIHNWPQLCFLAMDKSACVGAIVCKLDMHRKVVKRGYIAMLAVDEKYRKRKIGSNLVLKAIRAMVADGADEVVLETEITNKPALRLYENLGFVRDKRLFRYYLNGVDALRLKLWLR